MIRSMLSSVLFVVATLMLSTSTHVEGKSLDALPNNWSLYGGGNKVIMLESQLLADHSKSREIFRNMINGIKNRSDRLYLREQFDNPKRVHAWYIPTPSKSRKTVQSYERELRQIRIDFPDLTNLSLVDPENMSYEDLVWVLNSTFGRNRQTGLPVIDIILVPGGNAGKLITKLFSSGASQLIHKLVTHGYRTEKYPTIYVGASAGGIVAGRHSWQYGSAGMNLLPQEMIFFPHLDNPNFERDTSYEACSNTAGETDGFIALPDYSVAVLITDEPGTDYIYTQGPDSIQDRKRGLKWRKEHPLESAARDAYRFGIRQAHNLNGVGSRNIAQPAVDGHYGPHAQQAARVVRRKAPVVGKFLREHHRDIGFGVAATCVSYWMVFC